MNKLKTFIVDDEPDGIDTLRNFLTKYCPDVEIAGTAHSVDEAVERIKEAGPAYDEHALKAFKHHAVNYILKPVNIDELIDTVNRVKKLVSDAALASLPSAQPVNRAALPNKITLPVLDGLVYVEIDKIIRCEAEGNYTVFYFTNKPKMMVSKTLGSYEKVLMQHGFFRVHHHHLINLAHLERYQRGRGGSVVMSDQKSIAVSQRKRDEFLRLIDNMQD
jgi:two-component system, LytTR family, response regulator